MRFIRKLSIPSHPRQPKLFVFVVSRNGKQYRFEKVAWSLNDAITSTWCSDGGRNFVLNEYVAHNELSVDEINSLFKNFRP